MVNYLFLLFIPFLFLSGRQNMPQYDDARNYCLRSETKKSEPVIINFDYYISMIKETGDKVPDPGTYKLEKFTRLKSGEEHFTYYILQEIHFSSSFRTLLIAEDYESEQSCWIANYDTNNNLLDSYEVLYDNAEGYRSTWSIIDIPKRSITVKTHNIYENPEQSEVFLKVNNEGKFEVI